MKIFKTRTVHFVFSLRIFVSANKSDLARGWERHFRTRKRVNSLDTTQFRLPVLGLLFSPTSSGRNLAAICVNDAFINEIMLFSIISELISRITRSISLFHSTYL